MGKRHIFLTLSRHRKFNFQSGSDKKLLVLTYILYYIMIYIILRSITYGYRHLWIAGCLSFGLSSKVLLKLLSNFVPYLQLH